ncbi:MAG: hypothetical protein IJP38_06525 [Oscillospiraceae bacterium]|nr:hypothetical protein [Oscillospiraceae bacterium]
MKKRFTKALSLLIAVMLVIGIMPTAFAGDTDLEPSGVKIVYDLYENTDVTGQTTITGVKFPATKGFWAFEKQSASFNINRNNNNGLEVVTTVGAWWSIRVYVPKMGSYKLSLNHSLRSNAGISEIYFGKASKTADVIVGETALPKQIDFGTTSSTPEYGKVSEAGNVNVAEPGEYIIVFKSVAKGAGNGTRQYFRQVILDGCESGTEVAGVIGSVKFGGNDSMKAGDNAELSVTAYDGIVATALTTDSVIYESSDDAILSIDGATATAHKAGTVTVTANAEGWGNPVETTVTVNPAVPYSDATVKYSVELDSYDAGNTMTAVKFAETSGFWAFEDMYGEPPITRNTNYGIQVIPNAGNWWAMRIYVPKAGSYDLKFNHGVNTSAGVAFVYFGSAASGTSAVNIANGEKVGGINFHADSSSPTLRETLVGTVEVDEPGEYILVLKRPPNADASAFAGYEITTGRQYFKEVILDGCTGDEKTYVPMLNVSATPDTITVGDTATVTATATLMSDGVKAANAEISYATNDIVSIEGTTVTGVSDGIATVTATATVGDVSSSRSVNITVNNKAISDGFNAEDDVETYAPSVIAYTYKDGQSAVLENTETDTYITDNGDGTYLLFAPADEGAYKFLYWVKGLETKKRVISTSRSFTYSATKDNSHLIAVYENTADQAKAKAEFYNANMQLIDSNNTGVVPALPVLAGYGEAIAWVVEDGTEYTTVGASAVLKANGTTMFIAKYKDEAELDPISITATGATVSNPSPAYGDVVTVTANADSEGSVFQYFTKNGEVVCLDRSYTFNAYKTCEIVAVYGAKKPTFIGSTRKIFLDTFNIADENGLMAEFIGFENDTVVEKGIMLGTRKMPMVTDNSQFTIIADEEGTYKGYAILRDGESYIIITDGEYTK